MMANNRVKPEELELELKKQELEALEIDLSERELELETLKSEISYVTTRFAKVLLPRYARIERLRLLIISLIAKNRPEDEASQIITEMTNDQLREETPNLNEEVEEDFDLPIESAEETIFFKPDDDFKKLYREAAKAMHPDLANNEKDRVRREELMRQVNDAYSTGDADRLERLLAEWESSPENVEGEDAAAQLVRIIRKIHQVKNRFETIEQEISEISLSEEYQLWEKVKEAETEGRNFINDLAKELDEQISTLQKELRIKRKNEKVK